jgi:hypothetical protein
MNQWKDTLGVIWLSKRAIKRLLTEIGSDENIDSFSNEAILSKNAIEIDSLQCAGYNLPSLKY